LEEMTGCPDYVDSWIATFAFARKDVSGTRKPQAIAHRGYKAKFPENTMGAFKGAVDVGADAIETDLHLSKDGIVVLSHVSKLAVIVDCEY
jgi:glycerophosphoryl diester phosphodiesterase